jgi:BlaR1 peptidase M56
MMLAILAESALRSLLLGGVVWIGLNLLRLKNPHVHMTSWAMVLVASLSMPLLMHWTTVTITLDPLPPPAAETLWPSGLALPEPLRASVASELVPGAARGETDPAVNWWALATAIYGLVASMLLLRLAVGIGLTWRLAGAAKPIREPWAADSDVRVSDVIGGPVTFGSTILLPPQCVDWNLQKRRAVLAHEGAHVANRDFYLLLLASLNRAVFWFSPFAWWQLARLAELAEIISDARALEVVEDKLSYAEILLDLVQHVRRAPAALEMARACTLRARVERILAATKTPAKLGWRKRIWTAAAMLPVVVVCAGSIAYIRPAASTLAVDAAGLDSYVGWYALGQNRVLAVTRAGDRMVVQETARPKFEVTAAGADTFSGNHDDVVIFLRDAQAGVTQVLVQEPVSGARLARRITAAKAKTIEEDFARRIAQVPDRFRDQTPLPGSKEAILRGIEDMQRGAPNYDHMSAALAAKIRRQAAELHVMFKALGTVESIFFRGVGPGGYDIYGVKFAGGSAEFRLLLGVDGKAEDVIFRPDGNDAPGGVVACSDEQGLRSSGETAPIRLMLYNGSGSDIRLYRLDSEGKRNANGAIGANMSSSIMTYVDNPWVIADASGKCLEIVLPGQRTRYHSVEGSPAVGRTAPQDGSEAMLRQYIEALSRGEPNYDRMTPEVAAQTRAQLPFDQAILTRLGELRAVSFRGVTGFGSDVYMAHFANGSAEWRIGLAKNGTIGRIALGPQS